MIIKGTYVNSLEILDAKIKSNEIYKGKKIYKRGFLGILYGKKIYEKEHILVITTTEKEIDGVSIGAVGYRNKTIHFILDSYSEGIDIINQIEDINKSERRK